MSMKIKLACFGAMLSMGGPASADIWTLVDGSGTSLTPANHLVSIQGVANTGGADIRTSVSGALPTPAVAPEAQKLIVQSAQAYSGGVGIANNDGCSNQPTNGNCDLHDLPGTAPEHAIDNQGRYEMALLTFDQLVKLTDVRIDWPTSGYDTDMTVLAYTGATTSATQLADSLAASTWGTLTGWTAVAANLANVASGSPRSIGNTNNVSSSYWLIGAYNPLPSSTGGGDGSYDYIKLYSVTGSICTQGTPGCGTPSGDPSRVPEPGTLALFGAALVVMIGLRQRALG